MQHRQQSNHHNRDSDEVAYKTQAKDELQTHVVEKSVGDAVLTDIHELNGWQRMNIAITAR